MSTKLTALTILIIVVLSGIGIYVLARETTTTSSNTITSDNVSFVLNSDMGQNVSLSMYDGDPTEDAAPGFSDAPYTQFLFYSDDESYGFLFDQDGGIRLYKTADLANYDFMANVVAELDTLISEQPDLKPYMEISDGNSKALPFLPVMPHGQTITARAEYIETDDVRGIGFITTSQAAAESFLNNHFFYTFQGLTTNGEYYVSLVTPLATTLFPAEIPADFDLETFVATMPEYLVESVENLNNAEVSDFSPSLTAIHDLIQSIEVTD